MATPTASVLLYPNHYYTREQAAKILGCKNGSTSWLEQRSSPKQAAKLRQKQGPRFDPGPKFTRRGRNILYKGWDLLAYLDSRAVDPATFRSSVAEGPSLYLVEPDKPKGRKK